jgi:hypothetical protein
MAAFITRLKDIPPAASVAHDLIDADWCMNQMRSSDVGIQGNLEAALLYVVYLQHTPTDRTNNTDLASAILKNMGEKFSFEMTEIQQSWFNRCLFADAEYRKFVGLISCLSHYEQESNRTAPLSIEHFCKLRRFNDALIVAAKWAAGDATSAHVRRSNPFMRTQLCPFDAKGHRTRITKLVRLANNASQMTPDLHTAVIKARTSITFAHRLK